jgi:hypothetical protein
VSLSDIATGLEVTAEQRDRDVVAVDGTGGTLAERLAPHADALPCEPATAAAVAEAYARGRSVDASARAAGIPRMRAAKTLHLLGEPIRPLGAGGRERIREWLRGERSRTEARSAADANEASFALAVYVETHDPIPAAGEALLAGQRSAVRRDPLVEARSGVDELL